MALDPLARLLPEASPEARFAECSAYGDVIGVAGGALRVREGADVVRDPGCTVELAGERASVRHVAANLSETGVAVNSARPTAGTPLGCDAAAATRPDSAPDL